MDHTLGERIKKYQEQAERVKALAKVYLPLEATKKILYAELYRKSEGTTEAQKQAWVHSHSDWKAFSLNLADVEADWIYERLQLVTKEKAIDCEYLSFKVDHEQIKRTG